MELKEVVSFLEQLAPAGLALAGDATGLQVGQPSQKIKEILVCLSLTEKIAALATAKKVNLVVSHHPVIFEPLAKIDLTALTGKIIRILIKNNISFFNAHTNLDIAPGGISDLLALAVGLKPETSRVLWPTDREKLYKLAVFVPADYSEKVFQAITSAGAGGSGRYDSCAFLTPGIGTFRPLKGAQPFIGQTGKLSRTKEIKIETIVSGLKLAVVLAAMRAAHPYQEIAYGLFPLANEGRILGLGRVGFFPGKMILENFIKVVRKKFPGARVTLSKNPKSKIRQLAVSPGGGSRLVQPVMESGAEIFLTGELKYHQSLELKSAGITVIEVGHQNSEQMIVPVLARYLKEKTNLPIITAISA